MAAPKTVRLVNDKGVVVTTTEENAGRLAGFSPEKKSAAKKTAEPKPDAEASE